MKNKEASIQKEEKVDVQVTSKKDVTFDQAFDPQQFI